MRTTHVRSVLMLLGAVLAPALALGAAGVAYAQGEGEGTGISVTIPSSRPTADPTRDPTSPPSDPGGSATSSATAEPTGDGDDGNGGGGGAGGGSGTGADGAGGTIGNGTDASVGTASTPAGTPPAAKCVLRKPATPAEPATDGGSAVADDDLYAAGQRVTLRSEGFKKGERVQLVWFAEPQVVKTVRADRKGLVEASWILDQKVSAGTHTAQLTGWCGEIALAEVLVASSTDASRSDAPAWAWWTGGGLGAAAAAFAAWQVFRVMRGSLTGPAGHGGPTVNGTEVGTR